MAILFRSVTRVMLVVAVCVVTSVAHAQEYPDRPIQLIVPFEPGGGSDRQARLIEAAWKSEFGQPLVYVYKHGAGGAIGASEIARSVPDGYTIGVHTFPTLVMQPLTRRGQFKVSDFDYLAQSSSEMQMLLVTNGSPYRNLQDFVEAARGKPGSITVGIVSSFGPEHVALLQLMDLAKIRVAIVPLGGGAKGLAGLLGNHVDALMGYEGAVQGELSRMRVLGVSTATRSGAYPDAPTFVEQGYPVTSSATRIWIAPKGLPEPVRERIESGLAKIYSDPAILAAGKKVAQPVDFASGEEVTRMVLDYEEVARSVLEKQGQLR